MNSLSRTILAAAVLVLLLAESSRAAGLKYLVLYLPPRSSVPTVYYATGIRPVGMGFKLLSLEDGRSARVEDPRISAVVELGRLSIPTLANQADIQTATNTLDEMRTLVQQYPILKAPLNGLLAALEADLARTERGDRKFDGQWLTEAEVLARAKATPPPGRVARFTTAEGAVYLNATVLQVSAAGVRIHHDAGLATVPLASVPADAPLLPEVKRQIAALLAPPNAKPGPAVKPPLLTQIKAEAPETAPAPPPVAVPPSFGATEAECSQFYGPKVQSVPPLAPASRALAQAHQGLDLVIGYRDGQAAYFAYTGATTIAPEAVESTLRTHRGDSEWKRLPSSRDRFDDRKLTEWERGDGKARAELIEVQRRSIFTLYGPGFER